MMMSQFQSVQANQAEIKTETKSDRQSGLQSMQKLTANLGSDLQTMNADLPQHFSVDLVGTYKNAIKGYKRGQVDVPTRIEQKVGYTDTASF